MIKNVLFYFIFFFLFLISFFLIEGEFRFYLFALWFGFLFLFSNDSSFRGERKQPRSVSFAFTLMILFSITTLLSSHPPLSLEKLFFYITSLSIFVFFRTVSVKRVDKNLFFYYFSTLVMILNLFVIFFTFVDWGGDVFSKMNLIVRNYGHNHYAAFLLLFIPIFWWQLLFSKENDFFVKNGLKVFPFLLLVVSYLALIFSLARLVLLISLIQLFVILFLYKRGISESKKDFFSFSLIKLFIFVFSFAVLSFIILSIPFKKNDSSCFLNFSNKEICKPISQNDRLAYWRNSLFIFKENVFFGSGLKTFNFASRKFLTDKRQITSYSHNIFLHNLAEGGIVSGGFFVFFIFYLFYKAYLISLKKSDGSNINRFLFISSASSLVNAFFDFDWNFFIIFSITLMFLAIILRSSAEENGFFKIRIYRYFILFLFVSLFIVSSKFVFQIFPSKFFHKKTTFFPYLYEETRDAFSNRSLEKDNFQNLYTYYKNDPNFLMRYSAIDNLESSEYLGIQLKLAEIDPVSFVDNVSFERTNLEDSSILVNKFVNICQSLNFINDTSHLDYWRQKNLAIKFFDFADHSFLAKKPILAAEFYKSSILLDPYIMENSRAIFLDEGGDYEDAIVFLNNFAEFDPRTMNHNQRDYSIFYENTLLHLFKINKLDNLFLLLDKIIEKDISFSWFLFRDLITATNTTQEKQNLLLIYDKYKDLDTWNDFLPQIEKIKAELDQQ